MTSPLSLSPFSSQSASLIGATEERSMISAARTIASNRFDNDSNRIPAPSSHVPSAPQSPEPAFTCPPQMFSGRFSVFSKECLHMIVNWLFKREFIIVAHASINIIVGVLPELRVTAERHVASTPSLQLDVALRHLISARASVIADAVPQLKQEATRRVQALFDQWCHCATPLEALRCFLRKERPRGVERRTEAWRSPNMTRRHLLYDYQFFSTMYALHRLQTPFCGARGLMLNLSPGLGKTAIALALIDLIYDEAAGPALVVCPSSVIYAWSSNVDKFFGDQNMRTLIFHREYLGMQFRDMEYDFLMQFKVVVITYDTLRSIYSTENVEEWRTKTTLSAENDDEFDDFRTRRRSRRNDDGVTPHSFFDSATTLLDRFDPDPDWKPHATSQTSHSGRSTEYGQVGSEFLVGARAQGTRLIFGCRRWPLVCFDESQSAANYKTKRHKACTALPRNATICLSGTPIRNNLYELETQMESLIGARDPTLKQRRRRWTVDSFEDYAGGVGLHRLLLSISYDDAGLQMPPLQQLLHSVTLTPEQQRVYDLFATAARRRYAAGHGSETNARVLSYLMRMRQIGNAPWLLSVNSSIGRVMSSEAASRAVSTKIATNDPLQFLMRTASAEDTSWCVDIAGTAGEKAPKIEATVDLIRRVLAHKDDEKIIVYSMFSQALRLIGGVLKKSAISFVIVTGINGALERKIAFDRFRCDPSTRVCLMTYPVGSVGLTLVEANHCVMLEPWYCYSTHLQALFRLWRIGQERTVYVHWMIAIGTIEKQVLDICSNKITMANDVLQQSHIYNWPKQMLQIFDGEDGDDKSDTAAESSDSDGDYEETTKKRKKRRRIAPLSMSSPSSLSSSSSSMDSNPTPMNIESLTRDVVDGRRAAKKRGAPNGLEATPMLEQLLFKNCRANDNRQQ